MKCLEEVQKIYGDASEWLKFIETKHAGLFAVWTAFFIAVITSDFFGNIEIFFKAIIIIPILIGILIDLASFVPFLNQSKMLRKRSYKYYSKNTGNMVFYVSIFIDTYSEEKDIEYSVERYKTIIAEENYDDLNTKIVTDYVKQIIDVSTVATIKAYLFNLATKYTSLIIIIAIATLIIA